MSKTVLIIEDDKDILDIMTYILQDTGFTVAGSGESVSASYVQMLNPALILLDHRLKDSFGGDLCLELKRDPLTGQIPIVLVSAVKELPRLAKESGADDYLNKPFDMNELVALVRRFL